MQMFVSFFNGFDIWRKAPRPIVRLWQVQVCPGGTKIVNVNSKAPWKSLRLGPAIDVQQPLTCSFHAFYIAPPIFLRKTVEKRLADVTKLYTVCGVTLTLC